jgi:hypothetical protein
MKIRIILTIIFFDFHWMMDIKENFILNKKGNLVYLFSKKDENLNYKIIKLWNYEIRNIQEWFEF